MTRRHLFRIRTVTAGVELASAADRRGLASALDFLRGARGRFEAAGYEVQTVRVAARIPAIDAGRRSETLAAVAALDRDAAAAGSLLAVGPIGSPGTDPERLAGRVAELVAATEVSSCSVSLLDAAGRIDPAAARAAAGAMLEIARRTPGAEGNFRFAAGARIRAGTPFFPVAFHRGPDSFALGVELPRLMLDALSGSGAAAAAHPETAVTATLRGALTAALRPLAEICEGVARRAGRRFGGIDLSPAPGLDASIAEVVETITGEPFGSPSTLAACALLTGVLRGLDLPRCGYCGLMLPLLEDRVLAARADEGRFGVAELLLYSAVCGTGLDVVPLPGDVSAASLAALLRDVGALSARLEKPLSARLFPLPGKRAGERVRFDNPHLTAARVMELPGGPTRRKST